MHKRIPVTGLCTVDQDNKKTVAQTCRHGKSVLVCSQRGVKKISQGVGRKEWGAEDNLTGLIHPPFACSYTCDLMINQADIGSLFQARRIDQSRRTKESVQSLNKWEEENKILKGLLHAPGHQQVVDV